MHISEKQLHTWAQKPESTHLHGGHALVSEIQALLKEHLPAKQLIKDFKLDNFQYEVYLEGAYASGTNINFTSSPKVVVQLNSVFWADRLQLSEHEKHKYSELHNDSEYKFVTFKKDIVEVLQKKFGDGNVHDEGDKILVKDGERAFVIVPACQYRLYKKFISYDREQFIEGIRFYNTRTNVAKTYYPKIHLRNCDAKDKDTDGKFKDTIRIFKHIRNELYKSGRIDKEKIPSYFLESLLYNCSDHCFKGTYTHCMLQSLQYIFDAILSGSIVGFISADEQELLIGEKMWPFEEMHAFIGVFADYFLEPEKFAVASV